MLFLVIDDGYEIKTNLLCGPTLTQTFDTLSDAKHHCDTEPRCGMIYDQAGAGVVFLLCNEGADIDVSTLGDILYIKRG